MSHRLLINTGLVASLVAVLLATGCDGATPLSPTDLGLEESSPVSASRGALAKARPFRLEGVGFFQGQEFAPGFPAERSLFDGRCSVPSDFIIGFIVEGHATHMGRVRADVGHCSQINFATGLATFTDGVITIEAANGDELRAIYEGASLPGGGFADEVQFTGGTGRFAGASGEGVTRGACDQATGTCAYLLEGAVAYTASSRNGRRSERPGERRSRARGGS